MTITNNKIILYANNKIDLPFAVTDANNGDAAYDFTNKTVKFAMSKLNAAGVYSSTAALEKSSDGADVNITLPIDTSGEVTVTLYNGDTANFLGEYAWQLEVYDLSGSAYVVADGVIEFKRNITETV